MNNDLKETEVNWQEGCPVRIDYYLVAIEYSLAVGYMDICYWDGKAWETSHPERIIAFCSFQQLKRQLNFKWPKPMPEGFRMDNSDLPDPGNPEEWEEV